MTLTNERDQLRKAARHEPAHVQPLISVLLTQLRNYERGDYVEKTALKAAIPGAIDRILAARVAVVA